MVSRRLQVSGSPCGIRDAYDGHDNVFPPTAIIPPMSHIQTCQPAISAPYLWSHQMPQNLFNTQSFILLGIFHKMLLEIIFFGSIFLPIAFAQSNLKFCKYYYYIFSTRDIFLELLSVFQYALTVFLAPITNLIFCFRDGSSLLHSGSTIILLVLIQIHFITETLHCGCTLP